MYTIYETTSKLAKVFSTMPLFYEVSFLQLEPIRFVQLELVNLWVGVAFSKPVNHAISSNKYVLLQIQYNKMGVNTLVPISQERFQETIGRFIA